MVTYLNELPYGWTKVKPTYDPFKHGAKDIMDYCEATFQDRRWGVSIGWTGEYYFRSPEDALMFVLKWG